MFSENNMNTLYYNRIGDPKAMLALGGNAHIFHVSLMVSQPRFTWKISLPFKNCILFAT